MPSRGFHLIISNEPGDQLENRRKKSGFSRFSPTLVTFHLFHRVPLIRKKNTPNWCLKTVLQIRKNDKSLNLNMEFSRMFVGCSTCDTCHLNNVHRRGTHDRKKELLI